MGISTEAVYHPYCWHDPLRDSRDGLAAVRLEIVVGSADRFWRDAPIVMFDTDGETGIHILAGDGDVRIRLRRSIHRITKL